MHHAFTAFLTCLCLWVSAATAEDDRRGNYDKSSKTARDGNQNQLQPDMMDHLNKAAQHMQKAQQAESKQDYGTANQEKQMAQMEQTKAQQLQQQMQANEKSAQANDNGSAKTKDESEATGTQQGGRRYSDNGKPIRESDGYNRASTTIANTPSAGMAGSSSGGSDLPRVPAAELANLSITPPDFRPRPQPPGDAAGGKTAPAEVYLTMDNSAKPAGNPSVNLTRPPADAPAAAAASTAIADGGAVAQTRLLAGTPNPGANEGGDFWKTARDLADAEAAVSKSEAAKNGIDMMALRGGTAKSAEKEEQDTAAPSVPGRRLSDTAFWKKVGSTPKECRITGRKTGTSLKRQQRCLRQARRKIEKRWQGRSSSLARK